MLVKEVDPFVLSEGAKRQSRRTWSLCFDSAHYTSHARRERKGMARDYTDHLSFALMNHSRCNQPVVGDTSCRSERAVSLCKRLRRRWMANLKVPAGTASPARPGAPFFQTVLTTDAAVPGFCRWIKEWSREG
jgi:hypothetical protein